MDSGTSTHHTEDVGRILLQVQEELKSIRADLAAGGGLSSQQVDAVLARAESDLRTKAEVVLNGLVNESVRTLPVKNKSGGGGGGAGVRLPAPPELGSLPAAQRQGGKQGGGGGGGEKRSRVRGKMEQARQLQRLTESTGPASRALLAERFGIDMSSFDRAPERTRQPTPTGRLAKGATPGHGAAPLPKINRVDPSAPPPPLLPGDASVGVLALMNKGLVPRGADLGVAFGSGANGGRGLLVQAPARMHAAEEAHQRSSTFVGASSFNPAALQLDLDTPASGTTATTAAGGGGGGMLGSSAGGGVGFGFGSAVRLAPGVDIAFEGTDAPPAASLPRPGSRGASLAKPLAKLAQREARAKAEQADRGELRESVDKIRGYNELLDTYSLHQFMIRHGRALTSTPEYISFRRKNADIWGAVAAVVAALEALLVRFDVKLAFVDGQAVVRLAADELQQAPSQEQLLGCIANREQVMSLLRLPGQRFRGGDEGARTALAATCLQAMARMWARRAAFVLQRGDSVAARRIQGCYRGHVCRGAALERLRTVRDEKQRRWEVMCDAFRRDWPVIKGKRRVAIHLPSLSMEEHQRRAATHFAVRQNMQVAARLCALSDPNVEVLYCCAFDMNEDVKGYYKKLLALGDVEAAGARYKFVVPENAERFPPHTSLAALLIYSPGALRRIRRFIKGKDAYIVPGVVGPEERNLALLLGVPLLSAPPDVASLYSTKSGAKRIFSAADVNIPVGAHDVYDQDELLSALVKLVATNLDVARWLVRVDDDRDGTSVGFLDVKNLRCIAGLRRERLRLSGKDSADDQYWARPEVQEVARAEIEKELESDLARLVTLPNGAVHRSWASFLAALLRVGCVVEAAPSNINGCPSINLLIEPSGEVHVVSTMDRICPTPHTAVGAEFPQRSVPHAAISGAAQAICRALHRKGVCGYVSVDFGASSVCRAPSAPCARSRWLLLDMLLLRHRALRPPLTLPPLSPPCSACAAAVSFWDEFHGARRMWATDITLSLTDRAASFVMFNFMMGGQVCEEDGTYEVGGEERSYLVHDYIFHPNLSQMKFGNFFNLCRLKGVSFDLADKTGTAFMVVDSLVGGVLGMLAVGTSADEAVRVMSQSFEFVQEQVGTRSEKGEFEEEHGNFAALCQIVRRKWKAVQKKRDALKRQAEESLIKM